MQHQRMQQRCVQASSSTIRAVSHIQHSSMVRLGGGSRVGTRRALPVAMAQKQQFGSFEDMINNSEVPVLVDFYATWCGPCQMLSKTLGDVATQLKGQLTVVKIDTDKYTGIASQHRIQALPTLILFKNGQPVDRIEGLLPDAQLMQRLRKHL